MINTRFEARVRTRHILYLIRGEPGIRTPGTLAGSTVFKRNPRPTRDGLLVSVFPVERWGTARPELTTGDRSLPTSAPSSVRLVFRSASPGRQPGWTATSLSHRYYIYGVEPGETLDLQPKE